MGREASATGLADVTFAPTLLFTAETWAHRDSIARYTPRDARALQAIVGEMVDVRRPLELARPLQPDPGRRVRRRHGSFVTGRA